MEWIPLLHVPARSPLPRDAFETRAFGPFLVIRTVAPAGDIRTYLRLARRAELQAPLAQRVRANLDCLRGALAGTAGTVLDVEGGWSAVIQVPATRSEEAWAAELLDQDGVLVHPGFFFDFPREAFLVVSLLTEPANFSEGTSRLRAHL